jgi:structural maintenance of chromosome 2
MDKVRATNLQDLIYKKGQAGINKASVTIVFNNSEKNTSPPKYIDCDTISVTRQVPKSLIVDCPRRQKQVYRQW